MTVDEALAAARKTNRCLVFWDSTTGESVEVLGVEPQADHANISSLAQAVFQRHESTFSHNVFNSAVITRETLQRHQSDAIRLTRRTKTLRHWSTADADELLDILEKGAYPPYMGKDYDSTILVDHLWTLHRDELTAQRQQKIRSLIDSEMLSRTASFHCNAYCLAFGGESDNLSEMWRSESDLWRSFDGLLVLMERFCHIQTEDLGIIHALNGMIEQPSWLFQARFKAMITAGSLDAARKRTPLTSYGKQSVTARRRLLPPESAP